VFWFDFVIRSELTYKIQESEVSSDAYDKFITSEAAYLPEMHDRHLQLM
jgi:hypothetical protein